MEAMARYFQSGAHPLAEQSRMNGPGGSPAVPGAGPAAPFCGDWSALCNPEEFAEAFDLTFDFFATNAAALAAGAQRVVTQTITPEARFVCYAMTGLYTVIPATERFSIQIRDGGSQRFLSNAFVPAENCLGSFGGVINYSPTGPRPMVPPRQFAKLGFVEITVQANAANANPITQLVITMLGWKILSRSALNATARRCR